MPFVQTTTQIAAGYNQTTFTDALKTFLAASLGAAIDDFTASNIRSLVFKPLDPADPDYNRVYLRVAVSNSLALSTYVSDAWNVGTHVGTREGTVAASVGSFGTTASPANLALLKSGEGVVLSISNGSNKGCGGMVKILDAGAWWNNATYHRWLSFNGSAAYIPANSGSNPLGVTTSTNLQATVDTAAPTQENPATGKRDLLSGGITLSSNVAYFGRLTDDLGYVTASGSQVMDTYTTDDTTSQTWVNLDGNTSRALVGRTG